MGKQLFFSLLLIFTLHGQSGMTQVEKEHVFLILNTHEDDFRGHGNLDWDDGYLIHDLKQLYPSSKFLLIRQNENETIKEWLSLLVTDHTIIDGLYISSHGGYIDGHDNPIAIIASEHFGFSVILNDEASVKNVFSPVIGKFSQDALIIIGGCNPANAGDAIKIKALMEIVAQNFGLTHGSLYMNESYSASPIRQMLYQPYFQQPSLLQKGTTAVTQLFIVITYPLLKIIEEKYLNYGYKLKVRDGKTELFRDREHNAQTSRQTTQEKEEKALKARRHSLQDYGWDVETPLEGLGNAEYR